MTVMLVVKPGKDFTDDERKRFEALVLKDPQVAKDGLSKRLKDAHFLAFLNIGGALAGTNALKYNPGYWRELEKKAGVSLPATDCFAEVGYLHVAERNRGKKLGDLLILATLAAVEGQGLFATIQSKNIASRRLFERYEFRQFGKSWPSTKVNDQLNLYVRPRG